MKRELRRIDRGLRLAGALALLCAAPATLAQNATLFVPETTAPLGTVGPSTLADDDAGADDAAGTVTPVLLTMLGAAIPPNAAIEALDLSTTEPPLLTLDTTTSLPGLGAPAEPRDVVTWNANTGTFSLYFDGSANGIPPNVRIDAVSYNIGSGTGLLLSFDTTLTLGALTVDDEDFVWWFFGPFPLVVFDGSAQGIAPSLDLDALAIGATAPLTFLLSFDGSGVVAGIPFDDEDVLSFDYATSTWSMYADSSLSDPVDWPPTDLVALPEPGVEISPLAGAVLLAWLARRKRRR